MRRNVTLLLIVAVTILGFFLRFYKIDLNPPSLTGDEISFGYSAYSVLKTGRDEFSKFLPLTFQSVGDYKNPVPTYLIIPSIALFGLSDFAVRFPNALIGSFAIPLFYLFLKSLLKDQKIALVGAFLLAISAWHISYSRYAYETLTASVFVILAVWSFIEMLDGKLRWAIISAFFFILTMYTAFAARLFVPFFVSALLVFNFRRLKADKMKTVVFVLVCFLLMLPLFFVSFFQGAGTRLTMVLISNDIEFKRYVSLNNGIALADLPWLFFFWLKRCLNYLQLDFIFLTGLNMVQTGSMGLGILYLFELPWLVLGVIEFIKRKIPYKGILVLWLLIGIIPDSLTNNQQHSGRLLQIAPVLILITTLGALKFFEWPTLLSKNYLKILIAGGYSLIIILVLLHAFLVFTVHFPKDKGESFDEGLKQVALFIDQHKNEYKEIVIDPRRGVEGPRMISNPYLYILFYSKYDPITYQNEPKIYGTQEKPNYQFGKYTIRYVDWQSDQTKKGTLFVGSPWDFPDSILKTGDVLEKIYLSNGSPAFFIVRPKVQ